MYKTIYRSIMMSIIMFILLGGVYPFLVTIVGNYLFPSQSSGGIIYKDGYPVGSKLIAQNFVNEKYFWGRPSAAGEKGFDATNSSSSNLSSTNKLLIDRMETSIQHLLKENPTIKREDIPVDIITTSASGLDPDISLKAAEIQIPRVAIARNMSENNLKLLVNKFTKKPILGFIGTESVNVLLLNIELDKETKNIKN